MQIWTKLFKIPADCYQSLCNEAKSTTKFEAENPWGSKKKEQIYAHRIHLKINMELIF